MPLRMWVWLWLRCRRCPACRLPLCCLPAASRSRRRCSFHLRPQLCRCRRRTSAALLATRLQTSCVVSGRPVDSLTASRLGRLPVRPSHRWGSARPRLHRTLVARLAGLHARHCCPRLLATLGTLLALYRKVSHRVGRCGQCGQWRAQGIGSMRGMGQYHRLCRPSQRKQPFRCRWRQHQRLHQHQHLHQHLHQH